MTPPTPEPGTPMVPLSDAIQCATHDWLCRHAVPWPATTPNPNTRAYRSMSLGDAITTLIREADHDCDGYPPCDVCDAIETLQAVRDAARVALADPTPTTHQDDGDSMDRHRARYPDCGLCSEADPTPTGQRGFDPDAFDAAHDAQHTAGIEGLAEPAADPTPTEPVANHRIGNDEPVAGHDIRANEGGLGCTCGWQGAHDWREARAHLLDVMVTVDPTPTIQDDDPCGGPLMGEPGYGGAS